MARIEDVSGAEPLCFGIHTRRRDPATRRAVDRAKGLLIQSGAQVCDLDQASSGRQVQAMLVFGGDGSLLHAARLLAPRNIPVLGINFGRVGYLCAVNEEQLDMAIERLIQGKFVLDKRTMLSCSVYRQDKLVWQTEALNEFLVGGCNRTVNLQITINNETFGHIRGDGIIVATKTGSTAYSFSAGGPVLLVDALCLVASNAVFSSAIHSLVLPKDAVIRLRNITRVSCPYVVADGQNDYQLKPDDELEIIAGHSPALLVDLHLSSPVETLHRGFQELMVRELRG